VKAYAKEAVEKQRAGKAIKPAPKKTLTVPAELDAAMKKSAKLKQAFNALTPGSSVTMQTMSVQPSRRKPDCPDSKNHAHGAGWAGS
jgi:uncharacterized protein YdeI (YjbR/CyaY-like superfamily)